MSRKVTPRSSLESLRKEAKRWLKALRANVEDARVRFVKALPDSSGIPTLRDVQHALAMEYGFSGWTALKNGLAGRSVDPTLNIDWVERFFEVACPDHHVRGPSDHVRARHAAMRILDRYPEIATANFYTEIVCGNLAAVRRVLAVRPAAASAKSGTATPDRYGVGGEGDQFKDIGPKGWEPLLYLCFTRLPLAAVTDNAVAIAEALLDSAANPNAFFMAGDSHYTPLVGAIGEGEEDRPPHPRRNELARLLMERGANPYDNQVIYNIHFHGDVLWFLALSYEFSVKAGKKADWDDPSWSMLAMGGYGNGARWHLELAINNNDLELAEWALTHGADPNAPPAPARHLSQESLHALAMRHGLIRIADLLVRHGATPSDVKPRGVEAFTAAAMRRDRVEATALLAEHPEYLQASEPMFVAAKLDRVDVAEFLLDLGVSPDVESPQKERPLHIAAYENSARVGRLLLERGAAVDPIGANYENTPLGAATYCQSRDMIELLGEVSNDIWELTVIGNVERLRELFRARPELSRTAGGGHTLLMWLPDDDDRAMELTKLLLSLGADPSVRNEEGQTAADRAERRGMFEIAQLLRSAEAGDLPGHQILP